MHCLSIINSMAKCVIWVIIPRVTGSEACNCTRQSRVLLQAAEQSRVVLSPKIVHLHRHSSSFNNGKARDMARKACRKIFQLLRHVTSFTGVSLRTACKYRY